MATPVIELYGLKNCDGCRKALRALEARGLVIEQFDIRDKPNTRKVVDWIERKNNWLDFVNKRSTTWRNLSDRQKNRLDRYHGILLMSEYPTLIKRPVLRIGDTVLPGYKEAWVDAALEAL